MTETFMATGEALVSPGSTKSVEPRVNAIEYGDGYIQRTGDGINLLKTTREMSFKTLTTEEKDYIEGFFEAHKGYVSFFWTQPGATVATRWIAKSWRVTDVDYGIFDISATFQQVYDN